jgi:hypothetical protein
LQCALRRQLLAQRRRVLLNRKDPLGIGFDFSELDAMAEMLWAAEYSYSAASAIAPHEA